MPPKVPAQALMPPGGPGGAVERRVLARRVVVDRRLQMKVVNPDLRKVPRRLLADRRGAAAGLSGGINSLVSGIAGVLGRIQLPIKTSLVKPPKPAPIPPSRPGAADLDPILVTRPDDPKAKNVAGGHFAAWGASADAPHTLQKDPPQDQAANPGNAVPQAPRVTVRDVNGNLVNGVVVTFAVAEGGGKIQAQGSNRWVTIVRAVTANGRAEVQDWQLGPNAKTKNALVATVDDKSVTFNATTN